MVFCRRVLSALLVALLSLTAFFFTVPAMGDGAFYEAGGRRVENLYDMTRYMIAGLELTLDFTLDEPVSDAWVYHVSANRDDDKFTLTVNGETGYVYEPAPYEERRGSVFVAPIKGFAEGENHVHLERHHSGSRGMMFVINLQSGRQVTIEPDHENWYLADGRALNRDGPRVAGGRDLNNLTTSRPYGGQIEIESPGRRMPVFREGDTIVQEISIPVDFYELSDPRLDFRIENAWTGESPGWGEISGMNGQIEGDRIIYRLELPAGEKGAYNALYEFGPEEAHRRRAELIVVGRIEQERVQADDIFSALDTELMVEIDCGDPDSPHPFRAFFSPTRERYEECDEARVVENYLIDSDGEKRKVRYVETGTQFRHSGSRASYVRWDVELEEEDINRLYMLEFDYPENRRRGFNVSVFNEDSASYGTETTKMTGDKYPLSGQLKTGRLFFYPRTPNISIMLKNKEAGYRGALSSIRVHKVENERLPAADVSMPEDKLFMELNERSVAATHAVMYPGSDYATDFKEHLHEKHDQLRRNYLSMENLISYLRFCGLSGYMPGSIMYHRRNYPSDVSTYVKTDSIGLLAEMFSVNDLDLVLMSHYYVDYSILDIGRYGTSRSFHRWVADEFGDAREKDFFDPVLLVDNEGSVVEAKDISHPEAREAYLRKIDEQLDLYAGYESFRGMKVFLKDSPNWGFTFFDKEYGFGDGTIARFEEHSGIDVPGFSGPGRFKERCNWISENAQQQWDDFRKKMVSSLMKKAADRVSAAAPGARLFVTLGHDIRIDMFAEAGRHGWRDALHRYFADLGVRVEDFRDYPGTVVCAEFGVTASRVPRGATAELFDWSFYSEYVQDYFYNGANTGALLRGAGAHENHIPWPGFPFETPRHDRSTFGFAAGANVHHRHHLNTAMAGFGASFVFSQYGDCTRFMGHEEAKATFAETFSLIPSGDYRRIDGSTWEITGRAERNENGPGVFYLTNSRGFDFEVGLKLGEEAGRPVSLTDKRTDRRVEVEDGRALIHIGPYGTEIFRAKGISNVEITDFSPDADQVELHEKLEKMGDKAYEVFAAVADYGQVQVSVKNTGGKTEENFIKITRHDGDPSLEGSKWEYGPVELGEVQVVTIPGRIDSTGQAVEGVVITAQEELPFAAEGRGAVHSMRSEEKIDIGAAVSNWRSLDFQELELQIREAGRDSIRTPEEIEKFPDPEMTIGFKSLWTDQALYILVQVPDDEIMRNPYPARLWTGDSVSVFLDPEPTDPAAGYTEIMFAPADRHGRKQEVSIGHNELRAAVANDPELLQWDSNLTDDGYVIGARFSIRMGEVLEGFRMYPGKGVGFDLRVNDLDSADEDRFYSNPRWNRRYYEWHNRHQAFENHEGPDYYGRLILNDAR